MSTTKVTLRQREYPSGKISLYLDFYPALLNLRTREYSRREYLGILSDEESAHCSRPQG